MAVITREQRIPFRRLGSKFHLELLGLLSRTGPWGRAYLEQVLEARCPILPWRRARFRSEVRNLLQESAT